MKTRRPDESERPVGPGMLASHYAPEAGVATNVVKPPDGMEFIGFGPVDGSGALRLNLSHDGSLLEAAANLFDMLHAADGTGTSLIGVAPIPETGLGEAINEGFTSSTEVVLRRADCRCTARRPEQAYVCGVRSVATTPSAGLRFHLNNWRSCSCQKN